MLILAAVLSIFVYGMIAAMLGTLLPELSARFALTPKQNGTVAFCQAIGLMVSSLGVGPLLDNEGKKIGLILGLGLATIALLLLPKSRGFPTIAAFLLVLGLGGGIIVTAGNALASDVDPTHRATALNLANLFFGLGGFATPFIAAHLLKNDARRLCYTVAAATFVALAVVSFAPIPSPTGAQTFAFSQIGDLLTHPTLWLLSLMLFLYVASEVGVWNWLVQHLMAQGIPESKALNVLSLGFALGLLAGRVGVARVLVSVPSLTVLLAASLAMAVLTYAMLQTSSPAVAWILVFLAGVSMAPVFPTVLAIIADHFPHGTGTAIGLGITFGWIGLAVSSSIIGGIAGGDHQRLRKALLVLPVMAVLMVGLNLILRAALP